MRVQDDTQIPLRIWYILNAFEFCRHLFLPMRLFVWTVPSYVRFLLTSCWPFDREYLLLISINNVHTYLKHMNDAVLNASDTFDGTQNSLTSTFWPAAPDSLLLEKQLLNGLGVVFAVLFAFVGAAVERVVAGLVGGLSAMVGGASVQSYWLLRALMLRSVLSATLKSIQLHALLE